MIPIDAIAVVTPHGRYERIMRSPKETSHCGHRTATNEIAWRRDTKNGRTSRSRTWCATPA